MSYGLFPELFESVEADIDAGLYDQARDKLTSCISRTCLSGDHRTYAEILLADIDSYTAHFNEALARQKAIFAHKRLPAKLRAVALMSHAYTLGYSGDIARAYEFFLKAQNIFQQRGLWALAYRCRLGIIDVLFYEEHTDRQNPAHNTCIFSDIRKFIADLRADRLLCAPDSSMLLSQAHFRKAMLHWLGRQFGCAQRSFEYCMNHSAGYFTGVWACFGALFCALKRGAPASRIAELLLELKRRKSVKAWKKIAMKYWAVALLLGRTWELLGEHQKTRTFYRKILKNQLARFTKGVVPDSRQALFLTRYFYPIYQEDLRKHLLMDEPDALRFAIARSEIFRARFLTETHKRRHRVGFNASGSICSLRIDEAGQRLVQQMGSHPALLYCFDFGQNALLLLSHDLNKHYEKLWLSQKKCRALRQLCLHGVIDTASVHTMSSFCEPLLSKIHARHLLVVPHGIFTHVPFHRMKIGTVRLLEQCTVGYWPSLTMAALAEQNILCTGRILLIGTRHDSAAHTEITELKKYFGKKRCDVLFDPTASGIQTALKKPYAALHITAHGTIDSGQRRILLTFGQHEVCLQEVINEKTRIPPLVVLHICYGGALWQTDTDLCYGLPITLMNYGARAVIGSSHAVPQNCALSIAQELYHALDTWLPLGEAYSHALLCAGGADDKIVYTPALIGNSLLRLSFN